MAVSNKLAPATPKKPVVPKQTFTDYITQEKIKTKINDMVGGKNSQRFITTIVSAVSSNGDLATCTFGTIIAGALLGESLQLSPSPQLGHYYLVPYNVKKKDANGNEYWEKVAQFQLGYKGYIQLAVRSNFYRDIDVLEIKEGEYLGRDQNTGKHRFKFISDCEERKSKNTIGYLAYFEYLNGFTKHIYWTKKDMEDHAITYSKAYRGDKEKGTSYSFWTTKFDDMAFKTMIRQLISRWGIMSIELQTAIERDMAVIEENESYEYVDNDEPVIPITPAIEKPVQEKDPADNAVDQFFNQ